jgi:radical SAM superfamily enzyme YgiQ (UPF0313 family)
MNPQKKFEEAIKEFQPDVVGFTAFTSNKAIALQYAKKCGNLGLRAVIGGHAATFDWKTILNSSGVDAVVCGEGEYPLIALLDSWETGREPSRVPGLHLKSTNDYHPAVRISNFDELPTMDFDLIDIKPYIDREALGMVTSRGCPYSCLFCSCQSMWSKIVTYRSIDNIIIELDNIVDRYNYDGKFFTFFDDTFTLDRKRILDFCISLKKRSYTITWKAMTRVDRVDPELLKTMYEAGCRHVVFGIEATTDEDLSRLQKGFTTDQAKRAVAHANKTGLVTEGYFIIGFPWQRREDLFSTVDRIREFDVAIPRLSCLTPYPGTHFGENLSTYGMRMPLKDHGRFDNLLPVVETDGFNLHDQAEAMLAFIDSYILKQEKNCIDSDTEIEESITDSYTGETGNDNIFHETSKDDTISSLIMNGRIPRLSPFIALRKIEDGYLFFEYRAGNFALLNRSAAMILKACQNAASLDEILEHLRRESDNAGLADIVDVFKLFQDSGLVVEE